MANGVGTVLRLGPPLSFPVPSPLLFPPFLPFLFSSLLSPFSFPGIPPPNLLECLGGTLHYASVDVRFGAHHLSETEQL